MKDKTTVTQGAIGLSAAIFYYQSSGYNVSIPRVDNSDYDLVIEKDSCLQTVQVKTTRVIDRFGNYQAQLKKVRPNRTGNKIYNMARVDFLFVYCENGDMYSVPFDKLTSLIIFSAKKFSSWKVKLGG